MDAVINRFHLELNSLKSLIDFFETESSLLEEYNFNPEDVIHRSFENLRSKLIPFSTQKREFNYNSIIISLYGYFEKYIEDSLISTSDRINKIFQDYEKIPDLIQEKHLNLSLRLLEKISTSNSRSNLSTQQVIKNLNQCINIKKEFILNNEAFSQHSFNYRAQSIQDSFSNFGIKNFKDLIRKEGALTSYIVSLLGKPSNALITEDEAFSVLEDLVERRNEVAHGVASQILSLDILREYIEYFIHFSVSLTNSVVNYLNLVEANELGLNLGRASELLKIGTVLVINNKFFEINIGDTIIGLGLNNSVKAKILNIQTEGKDLIKVKNSSNMEVGLLLDKRLRKNYNIYLVQNKNVT
jgi:hypothetical protein